MKKNLLVLLISFLSLFKINAQPVLNSSEMLPFGAIMQEQYISNLDIVDTALQGANQTWNFSGIIDDTSIPDLFVTITDPATTPHGSSFPSANYAYTESPSPAYRFFNLSSTKMERVGTYQSNLNTYTDPQVEYVFPMMFGTTNNDTWASTNSSSGGTYDLQCLGYGSLTTPGGTFPNALMVRVKLEESFVSITAYFWYNADNGSILLEYIHGDGIVVSEQGFYMQSLSIGIEENDVIANIKYTNPVHSDFQLQYQSKTKNNLHYTLQNSLGQIQSEGLMNASSSYFSLDFDKYSPGIYFLNISTGLMSDRTYTIKLIKL